MRATEAREQAQRAIEKVEATINYEELFRKWEDAIDKASRNGKMYIKATITNPQVGLHLESLGYRLNTIEGVNIVAWGPFHYNEISHE